jgi:hypothetical protein
VAPTPAPRGDGPQHPAPAGPACRPRPASRARTRPPTSAPHPEETPLPTNAALCDVARGAARDVDRLAETLITADPDAARRILSTVLDAEDGVLGRIVHLLATASYHAQGHGDPHAALYGRFADDLHDLVLDLDDALHAPATRPLPPVATPPTARRSR